MTKNELIVKLTESICLLLLIILCAGKPDLLDAIINKVSDKGDCYETIFHIEGR